jgi:hypothetical protein
MHVKRKDIKPRSVRPLMRMKSIDMEPDSETSKSLTSMEGSRDTMLIHHTNNMRTRRKLTEEEAQRTNTRKAKDLKRKVRRRGEINHHLNNLNNSN